MTFYGFHWFTTLAYEVIIRRFDAVSYRLTIIRSLHNLWTKAIFLFADSDCKYTGNLRTTGKSLFAVYTICGQRRFSHSQI